MSKQASKRSHESPTFTIKDNILIGEEVIVPDSDSNVGNLILETLERNPEAIGQIEASTGQQCTYREMKEKTIRCALWMKKQGVKQGDVVAVCTCTHFDNYVPLFASFCIGAICAPEFHKLSKREFRYFLTAVTPKLIFLHEYSLDTLVEVLKELNMDVPRIIFESEATNEVTLEHILSMQTSTEVSEFRPTDIPSRDTPAMLLNTSGTTSRPKVVVLSHYVLRVMGNAAYSGDMKNQIVMCLDGLRWLPSTIIILKALSANATRIIAEYSPNVRTNCEVIKKHKVGYYATDTNEVRQIFKFNLIDEYRSTNLKTVIFTGSAIARHIHESLTRLLPEINFFQLYGSTETGIDIARQTINCQPGSCGYVAKEKQVRIVSTETGETLGPNKEGELRVKSLSLACDYWKNTELYKKSFDSEGWFCTNDIGYYDETGEIYITGRFSQFIKYKDCRLSDLTMEAVLEEHPAIYRAVVVGIPAEIEGEVPVAVVAKTPGKETSEQELMNFFKSNVSIYYKLSSIKFVEEFPRTLSGKIIKKKLKEMIMNGTI